MPPPKPHMVSTVFQEADHIDQIAQRPLKPTGQPVAGAWGFFEQGIWLGALVYVLPLISLSTFGVGYAAWKGYQRLSL